MTEPEAPESMPRDGFPADLLMGCIEAGGRLRCEVERLEFTPGEGEPIPIALEEIAEMRLGGRSGADANRMDLRLSDGRTLTLLIVGRDRVATHIRTIRGWEEPEGEHAEAP